MLQKIKFFKNHEKLTPVDLKEIAIVITYQEFEPGSTVMQVGEVADSFYVILDGTVSVQIRNEIIENWDWAHSAYKALQSWKTEAFDKKVEKHMAMLKKKEELKQESAFERKHSCREGGSPVKNALNHSSKSPTRLKKNSLISSLE